MESVDLETIIRFCLERKFFVFLIVLLLLGWGVLTAPFDWTIGGSLRAPVPVDAIPDIGENQQIVFTEWTGRSPQDVEDQITYPLTVSLLGIPGVKTIRSYSMFGFSTIYVIFEEDVDFYWSRSRILEKLNSLPTGTLPADVQPALGPDATAWARSSGTPSRAATPRASPPAAGIWTSCGPSRTGTCAMPCCRCRVSVRSPRSADSSRSTRWTWIRMRCAPTG